MLNLILDAATTPANSWWIYLVLIVLIVLMLVVPMFTQRKRAKEYNDMISGVNVGDTIRTVGGVIGRITKINDKDGYKTIILETGAKNSKTTMEFDIASIGVVIKSVNKPVAAEEKKEEKQEEVKVEETIETSTEEELKPAETVAEAEKKEAKATKTSSKKSSKK